MALYKEQNIRKNEAILEKVRSILDNAEFINEGTITIVITRTEITDIRYSTSEYVIPAVDDTDDIEAGQEAEV